jgi:hypothetical protein
MVENHIFDNITEANCDETESLKNHRGFSNKLLVPFDKIENLCSSARTLLMLKHEYSLLYVFKFFKQSQKYATLIQSQIFAKLHTMFDISISSLLVRYNQILERFCFLFIAKYITLLNV